MAVDIVSEIVVAVKALLPTYTGFTQIDYEYDIEGNSERGLEEKFGFVPRDADFADGRAMGFTTMDHVFQLILVDTFINKDDDTSQHTILMNMYKKIHGSLVELQKSRLTLPTPTNKVLLIRGLNIEEPEVNEENGSIALRLNFNIRYSYQNN